MSRLKPDSVAWWTAATAAAYNNYGVIGKCRTRKNAKLLQQQQHERHYGVCQLINSHIYPTFVSSIHQKLPVRAWIQCVIVKKKNVFSLSKVSTFCLNKRFWNANTTILLFILLKVSTYGNVAVSIVYKMWPLLSNLLHPNTLQGHKKLGLVLI